MTFFAVSLENSASPICEDTNSKWVYSFLNNRKPPKNVDTHKTAISKTTSIELLYWN